MLKFIALFFMTIDHIGHYLSGLLPTWIIILCRCVGRLAFPIFAYSVALGYRRTRNFFRYGLRLLTWGFIAELIMRYARNLINFRSHPNVLFTLCLGVVFLTAYELYCNANLDRLVRMDPVQDTPGKIKLPHQYRFNLGFEMHHSLGIILGLVFMGLSLFAAYYFETDYGAYGVLTVFLFHLALKEERVEDQYEKALLYLALFNLIILSLSTVIHSYFRLNTKLFNYSGIQGFAILSVLIIFSSYMKEAEKGPRPPLWQKYFFYLYYPLHVLAICYIRLSMLR